MSPFVFNSVTTVNCGRGKIAELGEIARGFGRRVLVVYNGGEIGGGGAVDRAAEALRGAGIDVSFRRQRGEPTTADVDAAVAAARGCDALVGIGGGSAIDCAKAAAGLVTNGGVALDYMEVIGAGQKIARPALPWIAVPTTAGTGAEVTRNAVVGSPQHRYKASLRSEQLLARVALIDAELAVGTPREVTAASGMDAFVQLLESATSRGANAMTRPYSLAGLHLAAAALLKVLKDGSDLDARESMAIAALQGGVALTNAGLGAVHGFAAPLGARFPIPHGVVCGVLLPHVVEANLKTLRELDLPDVYADAGRFLASDLRVDDVAAGHHVLDLCRQLCSEAALPPLGHYGFTEAAIPEIVDLAKKASSMRFNPVVLPDEALANILRAAR